MTNQHNQNDPKSTKTGGSGGQNPQQTGHNPLELVQFITGCTLEEAGAWLMKTYDSDVAENSLRDWLESKQTQLLRNFEMKHPLVQARPSIPSPGKSSKPRTRS